MLAASGFPTYSQAVVSRKLRATSARKEEIMSNGEKGKMSLTAAGGFTLLGVVLTVAALFIPAVRLALGGSQKATKNWHATITLLDFTPSQTNPNVGTGNCDFKANHGGNDVANRFPSLSIGSRDDIDWTVKDGRSGHHDPSVFSINFPSTAGGSPFSNYTFPSTNGHRVSSGSLTTTTYGDFQYDSITLVTVDDNKNVSCSNAKDPGVHVDQ